MTVETLKLRGRAAAPGLAAGPLARMSSAIGDSRAVGSPEAERTALRQAIAKAAADLETLATSQPREAVEILEFQAALLEDEDLYGPALSQIDAGTPADRAWDSALGAQIADYAAADDDYFRGRAADLADLRDRVRRAIFGEGRAASNLPEDAILVADDLAPTRFLEIDWARSAGIALTAGSASSHVAMLARSCGVPMVIGLGDIPAGDGTFALLDGDRGEIEIAPSAARVAEWRWETARLAERSADEARFASAPAVTRSGRRLSILVNIQGLSDLSPDAAHADGVGLVRTEFLLEPGRAPPDETTQYEAYCRILAWSGARPVTIRTLDAGGDKPIPGVTFDGEANPFLGEFVGRRHHWQQHEDVQTRPPHQPALSATLARQVSKP